MFVKSGYGKTYFDYQGITHTVFDSEKLIPRYENVTSFTTLKSVDFAGAENTYLTFAEYLYPEAFFNTQFIVDTITDDEVIPISIKITPQFDAGATTFVKYIDEKINHDSGDDGLARIIINDTHTMPETFHSDEGYLRITIKRIASLFDTFEFSQNDNVVDTIIGTIKQLYLGSIDKQRLDAEFSVGISAPSSMDIAITANGITHTINGKYFDFSQDHTHTINISQENSLDVT